MICAACGGDTAADPCAVCGEPVALGAYTLLRALGHGTTGTTWLARDAADALVAIKELRVTGDPKGRELLAREVRVLRELSHPDIPRYVEDFAWGTGRTRTHCVVQEYVEGPTLAAEIGARRFTVDDVLDVIARLLVPLAYLHALSPPVVHRDLKPANVILRPDGRVAIVDFGAVRDAWKGTLGGSTVAGTFGYMAPEQFHGDATPASDVYGVAALAVALLARRDPSTLLDRQGKLNWRGTARVPPPVAALLDQMLEPDPDLRPKDAASTRAILVALRASSWAEAPRAPLPQVVRALPPAPAVTVARPSDAGDPFHHPPDRRDRHPLRSTRRAAVNLIGAAACVAVGVALGLGVPATRPPPPPPPPLPTPATALTSPSRPVPTPAEFAWVGPLMSHPQVQGCLASPTVATGSFVVEYGSPRYLPDPSVPALAAQCINDAIRGFAVPRSRHPVPVRFALLDPFGGFLRSDPIRGWPSSVVELHLVAGPHDVFLHGPVDVLLPAGHEAILQVPSAHYLVAHGGLGRTLWIVGDRCTFRWDHTAAIGHCD